MALAEVKAYFKQWNMEGRIMELGSTTATVTDASLAHGVAEGQIGKP